jgi:KaiC/GvpD/RAD55 family RecA-like ATPase
MKETKKNIQSNIWDSITYGNYWGALLTVVTFLLLYQFSLIGVPTLYLLIAAFFDAITHYLALLSAYYLVLPILKSLNIFKRYNIPIFIGFPLILFSSAKVFNNLSFPRSQINVIFPFIIFSLVIISYFIYLFKRISKGYSALGFVHKPFLIGSVGMFSYLISALTVLFIILKFPPLALLNELYYYIFFYAALSIVTVIQFLHFVVDYPSAIQPRWRSYMPVDPIRIAAVLIVLFFAVSLYFTVKELEIILAVPLWAFGVIVVVFVPLAALFTYSKAFAGGTTLSYWTYLKTDMTAHLGLTLYVLSTAVIVWNHIESDEKLLYGIFFGLSFVFYTTAALDIKNLTKGLNVTVQPSISDLVRYAVSVFSTFFIIFFIVLLTKDRITRVDVLLEKYPYFPLALIGIFLIFYFVFLRFTHRGFEELMEKGLMTNISYVASLGVFIAFFVIYLHFKKAPASFPKFPLFGTVFFGYLAILAADIYSTTTLRVKEYKGKKNIVDLLNHIAGHFFRTDILEEAWDTVIDRYSDIDSELERARFYPPARKFDIGMVSKKAGITASVAMLLEMDKAARKKDAPVVSFDQDVKTEIEAILGENLLLLPEALMEQFNTAKYYPELLSKTFDRINNAIKPFVPSEEHTSILNRLVSVDPFFNSLSYDAKSVKITENIELNRKEFLMYLKLYIKALEEIFPFNRLLLRESVKSEVDARLSSYGFTLADVLNLVPIGVKEMDNVLFGGVVKGTSTLFLSEERRAKNDVIFLFANEGLKNMEPVIFATSRRPSKEILKTFKRIAGHTANLTIIDLYVSAHTDNMVPISVVDGPRTIIPTSLIHARQELVKAVKKHPKEAHKRIVLDIYIDLAKYHDFDEISDLIIRQVEGFRRWNCTSIITLSSDLSSEELERHFDNVFHLTDVSTFNIKKLFGGKPKKDSFILWESYSPIEEPGYSLFLEK